MVNPSARASNRRQSDTWQQANKWPRLVAAIVLASLTLYLYIDTLITATPIHFLPTDTGITRAAHTPQPRKNSVDTKKNAIVVAATQSEDTAWLDALASTWSINIYRVDDPTAKLTVMKNVGYEGSAYLTFIIDNYYDLPDVVVFLHGRRYQWHNDEPMYDGLPLLSTLRLDHVASVGFANLRCTWYPGCPVNLQPDLLQPDDLFSYGNAFAHAWTEMFPGEGLPTAIGTTCCAQFAVTRDRIHARPVQVYQRLRKWLWTTRIEPVKSGRIMEYTWHILFGKDPVSCPKASSCFCDLYGLCDLTCQEDGSCQGRWWPPWPLEKLSSAWPAEGQGVDGWPVSGWWHGAGQ